VKEVSLAISVSDSAQISNYFHNSRNRDKWRRQ